MGRGYAVFIEARFAGSGIRPDEGLGESTVDLAANVPCDVQRLAHEIWEDVRHAGNKTAGRELMSVEVRTRHRLPGTSTSHDIITRDTGRYATVDSLYREWVARKTY